MKTIEELKAEINKKEFLKHMQFDRETINEEDFTVELSLSSEEPYERWFGWEILDHNEKSIRLERFKNGAAFRDTHYGDQIGVIIKSWVDSTTKKLRAVVKFSKNTTRAVELFKDIKDGIRQNVSIRYLIHELLLEKEVEGVATYRVTDWEPIHGSLESDPADFKVGVGRSADSILEDLRKENIQLKEKLTKKPLEIKMEPKIVEPAVYSPETARAIYKIARDFQTEVTANVDLLTEADSFVKEQKSELDFNNFVLAKVKEKNALKTPLGDAGFNDKKDMQRYSVIRAIKAQMDPRQYAKDAGYELEISNWIAKKTNQKAKGIYIPNELYRAMTEGTAGSGAEFVATNVSSDVIEPLRNRMVATKLGAQFLDNLSGDLSLPKLTGSSTFGWRSSETATISATTPTTSNLSLTPKYGAAAVDISDALLVQSSPAVEALIRKDLNLVKALGIDVAALHGTGASGQPSGIAAGSGIGSVTIAAMDWDAAIEFESDVDTANALEGNLNFITTPAVRGKLKGRPMESGYPTYIIGPDNKMNGYPVFSSGQVSTGYIFFGNWEHLIIAEWGVTDLLVDPYTGARDGLIQLTLKIMVDIGVRYDAAFSVGSLFS
uniref:Putative capsid protein n=1 Tax=viral metagenome TaxID=1070528 RepID=A0A6H1ZLM3_9ZZZZ